MAKKKNQKDYDYYTMKIPNSLRDLFRRYIEKYESLGFKKVSQFALHILQKEAEKILIDNPDIEKKAKDLDKNEA